MVSNWYPASKRTPGGFYKNVSLRAHVHPFTERATNADASDALQS